MTGIDRHDHQESETGRSTRPWCVQGKQPKKMPSKPLKAQNSSASDQTTVRNSFYQKHVSIYAPFIVITIKNNPYSGTVLSLFVNLSIHR